MYDFIKITFLWVGAYNLAVAFGFIKKYKSNEYDDSPQELKRMPLEYQRKYNEFHMDPNNVFKHYTKGARIFYGIVGLVMIGIVIYYHYFQ